MEFLIAFGFLCALLTYSIYKENLKKEEKENEKSE